jgi:hypothetical protein
MKARQQLATTYRAVKPSTVDNDTGEFPLFGSKDGSKVENITYHIDFDMFFTISIRVWGNSENN